MMSKRAFLGASCRRFFQISVVLVTAFGLAGCWGMFAYREGNTLLAEGKIEAGLAKLEEAVALEPRNAEYRIAYANRRASIINRYNLLAEVARREGRLSDAEKIYHQAQILDSQNQMARQGLAALVMERRHRQVVAEADGLFKKGSSSDLADALEKLRPVLSENPQQKDATNLKARIDEARAKELRPEARLAAVFRKPISLAFRDASMKAVLEVVAKVSGLNFYYDKDIRPDLKVTIFAKNTTIEDALRLILVTNQLEQKVLNENSVLIYPNTPQKLKDYQTLAVRSFYLTNADVKAVSNTIKTIVKTKDLVTDERLGVIIMRDTPEAIRMAERIVSLQDISDPEVVLDVEILEVKRTRLMELGVNWPHQLTLSPLQFSGGMLTINDLKNLTADTTQATIGNVVINARKEDQDSNILANPRIRVRNKEKAKIQVGDRVPLITTTSTSTGFVSESVNYVDVGLKLEVEPTIYLDEEVAIKVNLEVSHLVREIQSKSGALSYQIGSRGANTVLRLKDGETQILAGLISDEDRSSSSKVPLVGELPIAGRLFGSQKDDDHRSEILLSITPRVVRSIRRPDMLLAEFESGTESGIGVSTLRISTVEPVIDNAQKEVPKIAPVLPAAETSDAGDVSGNVTLEWQVPAQVKAGEQFSAVLKASSQQAIRGMPLLIGFDSQVFQVASVQEGDFFKQGNAQTSFSQRVDPVEGKVFVALIRQSTTGAGAGVNGSGSLVRVNFKAMKAASGAKIKLLSASPDPATVSPVTMPVEYSVNVLP